LSKIKNQEEFEAQFGECLKEAHRTVPDDRKHRTKLSLAGTGGMRLLQLMKQIFEC
jgi:hypothetical protein